MSLLTDFSDNVSSLLLDDWGEAATVYTEGGERSATLAIVRGPNQIEDGNDWRLRIHEAEIQGTSSATTGIGELSPGDGVLDASDVLWDFQEYTDLNGGHRITRFQRAEVESIGHAPNDSNDATTALSIAEDKLRRLISKSKTFRDEQTEEKARSRVHRGGYRGPFERPLAVVWQESYVAERNAGGSGDHSLGEGSLVCHMQYDGTKDPGDFFGAVVEEIRVLAGDDDPSSPYRESHLSLADTFTAEEIMEADKRFRRSLPFFVCRMTWNWGQG